MSSQVIHNGILSLETEMNFVIAPAWDAFKMAAIEKEYVTRNSR